jgi:hypothetical protein
LERLSFPAAENLHKTRNPQSEQKFSAVPRKRTVAGEYVEDRTVAGEYVEDNID